MRLPVIFASTDSSRISTQVTVTFPWATLTLSDTQGKGFPIDRRQRGWPVPDIIVNLSIARDGCGWAEAVGSRPRGSERGCAPGG